MAAETFMGRGVQRHSPAKWMAGASQHPGALRATAKAQGLIKGDETLTSGDLSKLAGSSNPLTRKRANLAKTYAKYRP